MSHLDPASQRARHKKLRVGIVGASGYGGGELLRLLLTHPYVDLVYATASEQAGKAISEVHPNLLKQTTLHFAQAPSASNPPPKELDCLFVSLPHGKSMDLIPLLPAALAVIDLGGDFRLRDPHLYARHYGEEHRAPGVLPEFIYGLCEARGSALRESRRVANPGCFATATLLALRPLIAAGIIPGRVVVDAKTGSSGSGAKPQAGTHHPDRVNGLWAYKPFQHQHHPEILQELRKASSTWDGPLIFQTHSVPLVRGIFVSAYAEMPPKTTANDVRSVFEAAYKDLPFIRLVPELPDVNWVRMSNYTDIGFAVQERELAVFAAIDNLVKGAAGQAIQNFNLMFDLPETAGLEAVGGHPA